MGNKMQTTVLLLEFSVQGMEKKLETTIMYNRGLRKDYCFSTPFTHPQILRTRIISIEFAGSTTAYSI